MRIFIFEFTTGGGGWSSGLPLAALLAEGEAMLRAVAADFAVLSGVEVFTTRDIRLAGFDLPGVHVTPTASSAQLQVTIERLAREADWTLLIAPETAGALLSLSRQVESAGGRLLSPPSACVEVATSKQQTAQRLIERGICVPRGSLIPVNLQHLPAGIRFPAVVKPDDGCGSQDVRLVDCLADCSLFLRHSTSIHPRRLEEFVSGQPASVAVLCGPAGNYPLPACEQRLSADGRFAYLGGRLPLDVGLNLRAQKLAMAAIAALPQPRGYVGTDLVLGDQRDGSADCVIEVNPRLTTSYVGLRALSRTNLAAAMLAVAEGRVPDLSFDTEQLEFTANGDRSPVSCSLSSLP